MEVLKCCKRCFHVLAEDNHRYSICTKPAFSYKSLDTLMRGKLDIYKTARRPSNRPSSCHNPGHISTTRFRRAELRAARLIQRYTGLQQRVILSESNHTLRVQTRRERHVARIKPLLAGVRRRGAQSKLSVSVNYCH